MSTLAERRVRVSRLLTEAASHKLLRADASHALERAREAYELSHAPPPLRPWSALSAYRLAHLVMRGPRDR